MKKILFFFFIFSLASLAFTFFSNQALAVDVCAKNGYYPHCEAPNSSTDRWVIYPFVNGGTTYLKNLNPLDLGKVACSYNHSGESYQCPSDDVCQDSGGPHPQNPVCVPNPKLPQNCTCSADGKSKICGGQTVSCASNESCTTDPNANSASCTPNAIKNSTCTCNTPGQTGGGNNGYTCKNSNGNVINTGFCIDTQETCDDSSASVDPSHPGVACDVSNIGPGSGCGDNPGEPACNPGPPPLPPCIGSMSTPNAICTSFPTPFGNISTDPAQFISEIFGILLAVSGAIAILLIMRAGYRIMMSRGKPDAIQQGREELIAAIVGLLFLIFALVILQAIGVDILHIPGLGAGVILRTPPPQIRPGA